MANDGFDVYFGNGNAEGENQYDFDSEIAHHLEIVANLRKLKSMREIVIRKIGEDRGDLFDELDPLIRDWEGPYPDLRKMFRPKEMDWLLTEYAKYVEIHDRLEANVLDFVIRSGYKDEPELAEDGKPLLRRTTPVHHVAEFGSYNLIRVFFEIYNRFDLNYIDDEDVTHFSVACDNGLDDVVEKFLEFGQDPNCQVEETSDPPLHTALKRRHKKVVELLLRNGADPNLANYYGSKPLHILCERPFICDYLSKLFFEINDDIQQTVLIDARDKLGNAPLHLALDYDHRNLTELLLRRGANPNLANEKGLTPLHIICRVRFDNHELVVLFFKINKEVNQLVKVDALDKLGLTPLQYAVANLLPKTVDVLLDHGADLSSFCFSTSYLCNRVHRTPCNWLTSTWKLASGILAVADCLEKREYELDLTDALAIIKLFDKYGFFKKSREVEKFWYNDEEFASKSKELMIKPSLSLYNLIRLPPKQAAKQLTFADYFELARTINWWKLPESYREICAVHLCEKMSRGFFQKWATVSFLELTRYRLPNLFCEMIIEKLVEEDLWRICLAAAGQNTIEINK